MTVENRNMTEHEIRLALSKIVLADGQPLTEDLDFEFVPRENDPNDIQVILGNDAISRLLECHDAG